MQKTRRLMDENSVFLILLYIITLGSESQKLYSSNVKAIRNTQMSVYFFFFWGGGEHAHKPKFGEKNFIRHFTRFNFLRLSLTFILKYHPILHVVKR